MNVSRALVLVLLFGTVLAGCTGDTPESTTTPGATTATPPIPTPPTQTVEACESGNVPAEPRTALESLEIMDHLAKVWSEDARLLSLTVPNATLDGRSMAWAAAYGSTLTGAYATLRQEPTQITCEARSGGGLPPPETRATLRITIDSPAAIARAREDPVVEKIATSPGAHTVLGATVRDATAPEEPGTGWRVTVRADHTSATRWIRMDGR